MSAAFLQDITQNIQLAAREADITGYIAYAPAGLEALFDDVLAPGTRLILADGSGEMPPGVQGFGRSLLHATQALFGLGHSAVCVLNSDSPTLPTACLVQAAHTLSRTPGAVLGAADDGGYYLLGMTTPSPRLYEGIAWSTDQVAAQTRAAAQAMGLPLEELPVWYDVDDRAALGRLVADLDAGVGYAAPVTAAQVAALDLRTRLAA